MTVRTQGHVDAIAIATVWVNPALNVSRRCQLVTDPQVQDLMADIQTHGQLEPVCVAPVALCTWIDETQAAAIRAAGHAVVLLHGFRRMRAVTALGHDTIRAQILDRPIDRAAAEEANLVENWGKSTPTDYDLAWAVYRMITVHHRDPVALGARIRRRPHWIQESVRIFDRVDPALLAHYRTQCTPAMRRRMIALATFEIRHDRERHRLQQNQWAAWESEAQEQRRTDPVRTAQSPKSRSNAANKLRRDLKAILTDPDLGPIDQLNRIRKRVL